MTSEFPRKLLFLFDPHTYKIAYGGRGGVKSENFAQALIILGAQKPLRILCTRETQRSIQSSVHAMLSDWIVKLGLQHKYEVQHNRIISKLGGEILFWGMQDMNAIKSIHDIDITWVEEAQSVPKESWKKLEPTVLRKPGSELWVSFNPELDTDETYVRFVLDPPKGAVVVKTSYLDNPWLSDELRAQIDEMREKDYQSYLHVFEGETTSAVTGAVYGDEMTQAVAEDRIGSVVYDRSRPVDTFWDLGFGDETAIWFAQVNNGRYNVIDYLQGHGKTIEHYLIQLQSRGYVYRTDWLPHDGVDTIIHARLAGGDRSQSIEQIMRNAGRNVRIVPKMHVNTGILAVRRIFPNCWFDEAKCRDGLKALKSYQWGKPSASGVAKGEPLHDWASHAADAFRSLAVAHPTEPFKPVKPNKRDYWSESAERYTFY